METNNNYFNLLSYNNLKQSLIYDKYENMEKEKILFEIKKVQIEMIRDRGYIIPDDELFILENEDDFEYFIQFIENKKEEIEKNKSKEKIKTVIEINNILNNIYYDKNGKSILVQYSSKNNKEIGIDIIKKFLKKLLNIDFGILIIDNKLSTKAEEAINTHVMKKNIQVFKEDELNVNPTKRISFNEYYLIPKDKEEEKLKELKSDKNQLGKLSLNDPIVKYYNFKKKDLIRIKRNDEIHLPSMCPEYYAYKVVI